MELELKHLVGYLPYGLKAVDDFKKERVIDWECQSYTNTVVGLNHIIHSQSVQISCFKPILRPLSDLTKEIDVNGEKFVPVEWFEIGDEYNEDFPFVFGDNNIRLIKDLSIISKYNVINDINYMPYSVIQKLLEWHFDIYGLISKGLAINRNILNYE